MPESTAALPEPSPRFQCTDADKVRVFVERECDGHRVQHGAELQDLSRGGAQICVSQMIRLHDAIALQLRNDASGLDITVAASVCWVRSNKDVEWTAGCSFIEPLSEQTIQSLSSLDSFREKDFSRLPIRGKASARIETNPSDIDVQLVDVSRSGVSLFSPEPSEVGRRMRLRCEAASADEFVVVVRRCCVLPGGYLLGCEFRHSTGYEVLRGTLQPGTQAGLGSWPARISQPILLTSRAPILLLGGILIGLASTSILPVLNLTLGLASVIAFVGLDHAARRRAQVQQAALSGSQVADRIEARLEELRKWKVTPVDVEDQPSDAELQDTHPGAEPKDESLSAVDAECGGTDWSEEVERQMQDEQSPGCEKVKEAVRA